LKLQTNYFKLDISNFKKIREKYVGAFGFVYCLAYTKAVDQDLVPLAGFGGSYKKDYSLVKD
jgi:hypothetical protein